MGTLAPGGGHSSHGCALKKGRRALGRTAQHSNAVHNKTAAPGACTVPQYQLAAGQWSKTSWPPLRLQQQQQRGGQLEASSALAAHCRCCWVRCALRCRPPRAACAPVNVTAHRAQRKIPGCFAAVVQHAAATRCSWGYAWCGAQQAEHHHTSRMSGALASRRQRSSPVASPDTSGSSSINCDKPVAQHPGRASGMRPR